MVLEEVARMGPLLVLAGLAVGWSTEAVSRAGGYGLIRDMGLGIGGSVLAGLTGRIVIPGDVGMVAMGLIGSAGVALVIAGQRSVWRSARLGA